MPLTLQPSNFKEGLNDQQLDLITQFYKWYMDTFVITDGVNGGHFTKSSNYTNISIHGLAGGVVKSAIDEDTIAARFFLTLAEYGFVFGKPELITVGMDFFDKLWTSGRAVRRAGNFFSDGTFWNLWTWLRTATAKTQTSSYPGLNVIPNASDGEMHLLVLLAVMDRLWQLTDTAYTDKWNRRFSEMIYDVRRELLWFSATDDNHTWASGGGYPLYKSQLFLRSASAPPASQSAVMETPTSLRLDPSYHDPFAFEICSWLDSDWSGAWRHLVKSSFDCCLGSMKIHKLGLPGNFVNKTKDELKWATSSDAHYGFDAKRVWQLYGNYALFPNKNLNTSLALIFGGPPKSGQIDDFDWAPGAKYLCSYTRQNLTYYSDVFQQDTGAPDSRDDDYNLYHVSSVLSILSVRDHLYGTNHADTFWDERVFPNFDEKSRGYLFNNYFDSYMQVIFMLTLEHLMRRAMTNKIGSPTLVM